MIDGVKISSEGAAPTPNHSTLRLMCFATLLTSPVAAYAACPANLNQSSYTSAIADGGSTCVYTADPVAITVGGLVHPVNLTGNMTVNGTLTLTDNTTASNTRSLYITGAGAATFEKDASFTKNIGGFTNAAVIEMNTSGTLRFKGNAVLTSNVGAPSVVGANAYNTRDTLRSNNGTTIAQKNLTIVSQGGTRTGLYMGLGSTTVNGDMFLDFQSTYYSLNSALSAALWSQGGTTTVTGASTIQTASASGSTPAVVVTNSTVTLNGLTTVTAVGSNSTAVDVRTGGTAQLTGSNNQITASGASGIGVQTRANGAFSSGTGLTVDAKGTSFNYLGATGSITLDAATAVTAPVVWNADASSWTTYTGTGGHYKGSSQLASGGKLILNLSNSALWEATAASSMTLLNLQGNAILDASLLPTLPVTGHLTNAGGVVSLARTDTTPTNVLDLTGVYTANGGTLALNTVLNDASTSTSDVLKVTSTASGGAPTLISVLPDAASAPAFTTGKGILLVQVTGGPISSAANAFALPGGYIDAGGMRYVLVQDADDGNWYLRSAAAGQLIVSKQVNVPAGSAAYSGNIPFTVACTNPTASFSGSIAVTNNSGTATPIDVVSGSTCTVAEQLPDAPIGYRWDDPAYTQPAPIPAGAPASATIVNTLVKTGGNGGASGPVQPVPTLSEWAVIGLSMLVTLFGIGAARARARVRPQS